MDNREPVSSAIPTNLIEELSLISWSQNSPNSRCFIQISKLMQLALILYLVSYPKLYNKQELFSYHKSIFKVTPCVNFLVSRKLRKMHNKTKIRMSFLSAISNYQEFA